MGNENLSFPSLERLILDFKEWRLTKEDGLMVSPACYDAGPQETPLLILPALF